jgi:Protein of unknown function (DUF3309)
LHKRYHSPFWQNLKLEVRKPDAAVREIRETPTFAHSDLCDCVPLSAYRNLIRAEHAQFFAANDGYGFGYRSHGIIVTILIIVVILYVLGRL